MTTQTQIVALSATGANLIWHETQNDFVGYEQDVPNTDLTELVYAKAKAAQYSAIVSVWAEVIDIETAQVIEIHN